MAEQTNKETTVEALAEAMAAAQADSLGYGVSSRVVVPKHMRTDLLAALGASSSCALFDEPPEMAIAEEGVESKTIDGDLEIEGDLRVAGTLRVYGDIYADDVVHDGAISALGCLSDGSEGLFRAVDAIEKRGPDAKVLDDRGAATRVRAVDVLVRAAKSAIRLNAEMSPDEGALDDEGRPKTYRELYGEACERIIGLNGALRERDIARERVRKLSENVDRLAAELASQKARADDAEARLNAVLDAEIASAPEGTRAILIRVKDDGLSWGVRGPSGIPILYFHGDIEKVIPVDKTMIETLLHAAADCPACGGHGTSAKTGETCRRCGGSGRFE